MGFNSRFKGLTEQNKKLGEKLYEGRHTLPQIPHGLLGAFSVRKDD